MSMMAPSWILDQIPGPLASFVGDGAYDQAGIYGTIVQHHPDADVIVPPRATTVPSEDGESTPPSVIGDGLRSRTEPSRATEVAIGVDALNRCLSLNARSPSCIA
jgi:hypothetical protein